ncbi:MAG TPA: hypothetical protein DDY78_08135 [Planctomycetales bacterium]|jgi:hypothetical protein|nr:hypothetical protein [Planctomycetales bacterium]
MTLEEFRKVWRAEPFQPFIINLADGRNVYVARSQYASRSYSGQTVFVYLPDDSFEIFELSQVASLTVLNQGAPRSGSELQA